MEHVGCWTTATDGHLLLAQTIAKVNCKLRSQ